MAVAVAAAAAVAMAVATAVALVRVDSAEKCSQVNLTHYWGSNYLDSKNLLGNKKLYPKKKSTYLQYSTALCWEKN